MLGIDWRAARIIWTVFLFVLTLFLIYLAREGIMIFVAAFFFAYMLTPLVQFVCRVGPGSVSKTVSLAVVYVSLLAILISFGVWLGGSLAQQASSLVERLPALIEKHKDFAALPLPTWLEPARLRVLDALRVQLDAAAGRIGPLLQQALGGILGLAGSLMFIIIVPILTFLFMKDSADLRRTFLGFFDVNNRPVINAVLEDIHVMIAQYMRSLVILSVLTSVVYVIFFEAIGLPYALLVSVLAAPLEFIPVFGPLIGTLLILSIAIFTGFPHIWWIVIFFVAYRMFQDYALQPYLMSSGVQLHPLLVLFGAFAGQSLGGLWGMFLSVPILAIIRIVFVRLYRKESPQLVSGNATS
ncbi:MAG TPA: AI-2E family transporter [Bryobacteraceae bacterium]|nr:AI-2E family transporter [Bryobacteraceae bacterium]